MHLEFQDLLKIDPELENKLRQLPKKIFSGKEHPQKNSKAVFFCYSLPAPDYNIETVNSEEPLWTEEAGYTHWYLYNLNNESIVDEPTRIISIIRSNKTTKRYRNIEDETLSDIRKKIEKHIKNTYLKKVQAPIGIKPILKAWMELS